jgi:hypothetical protein
MGMRDVSLRRLAAEQEDLFAGWQLRRMKFNHAMIDHRVKHHGWREVHRGVWTPQQGPLTRRQRLIAAVLTAPGTHLNALSTGDLFGFHSWEGGYETVVRTGGGGPRRYPALLVAHSQTLTGNVTRNEGLPTVTPERALLELACQLPTAPTRRAFREACRLGCTSAEKIGLALRGQRGAPVLRPLCERYADIPYHRCRSDAESHGLEVLRDAGITLPSVNVRVAGREADFVWRRWRLIIEVDSREFHHFGIDDIDKQQRWEAAGYTVRRIWANDVYFSPGLLIALAVPPNVQFTQQ